MKILVEKPDAIKLAQLDVKSWPLWTKEVSAFPWQYRSQEIAYIIEGEVTVRDNDSGDEISFGQGDLVTFSAGLNCTWQVKVALKKHYSFN